MSVFTYNDVSIPYAMHSQFEQSAVYDGSNTDRYLTGFDLAVQGILNTNYIEQIDASIPAGSDAATIMKTIRGKLLTPRKLLSVKVGGVELIPASLRSDGRDAENGPHPQSCSITQLTNNSFLITYRIRAGYWEGETGKNSGGPVLYNRWEETVDIDDCDFTTRTRTGKFAIRADNSKKEVPDDLRYQMAVLRLPPGFLRQSSKYTVSTNGLELSYTIVDKEVFKLPPGGSYKADGEYWETTTKWGAMRHGHVRVKLRGSKESDQTKMLGIAIKIASSKLVIAGAYGKGGWIGLLESSTVKVWMYENQVEVQMQAIMSPHTSGSSRGRIDGVAGWDLLDLTATPISDGLKIGPGYQSHGTASILLQAAVYYDPSLSANSLNATNQLKVGKPPGG